MFILACIKLFFPVYSFLEHVITKFDLKYCVFDLPAKELGVWGL